VTDSPLAYKWVAAPDNWPRNGTAIKATTIHMAEGGGTVSWLTRNDGNSSHYVVEYDGRVVQMVLEARAAGSINPAQVRTTDDAPYTYGGESIRYGVTAAKKVTGTHWSNPNACVIAIEVEGFAANGPNPDQRDALKRLVADIRRRRGPLGVLGHRDWQDYKACPGHKVPWIDYGGHGSMQSATPAPEDPVGLHLKLLGTVDDTPLDAFRKAKISGTGHSIFNVATAGRVTVADGLDLEVVQRADLVGTLPSWAQGDPKGVAFNYGGEQHFAVIRDISSSPLPVPVVDCTPAANTAYDEGVHAALTASTNGITSLPRRSS
jgi:hypothetical protein